MANRNGKRETKLKAPAGWTRICYGVDLRDGNPVLVKAVRSPAGVSLAKAGESTEVVRSEIGKPGVVVAVAMPDRESFTRRLSAPFSSARKARLVFPAMLDIELPFPLDECVYDFLPSGLSDAGAQSVMAVGARIADAEKRIEACRAIGFDPEVLDHEGLALWTQSISEIPIAAGATRVVAFVSAANIILTLGRANGFISSHSVRRDIGHVDRVLKAVLQPSDGQLEWAWTGPGAADKEQLAGLEGDLTGRWPGRRILHSDPAFFLARALAARALTAGPLRCNLRTGSLEHPLGVARARRRELFGIASLLAAGVMLCILAVAGDLISARKTDTIKKRFEQRVDSVAGRRVDRRGEDALKEVETALKKQAQYREPFLKALSPSLQDTLALILENAGSDSIAYETVSLRDRSVSITGSSAGWAPCEKLISRLKDAGFIVKANRRESSSDGRVRFSITPGDGNG